MLARKEATGSFPLPRHNVPDRMLHSVVTQKLIRKPHFGESRGHRAVRTMLSGLVAHIT